jgi:short-subunit dehydrogenase involved in D-alanine esterification of teichoic acids
LNFAFWFWVVGANGPRVEIKAAGGKAVADYNSVVNGDKIVETAVKAFGTVHILLNNAGMTSNVNCVS